MLKEIIDIKLSIQLQTSNIQLHATMLGVSADSVCSSPTNVGHKQYLMQSFY